MIRNFFVFQMQRSINFLIFHCIQETQFKRKMKLPRFDCVNMSNRRWWWKNRCSKSIEPSRKLNHHLLWRNLLVFTRNFSIDKDEPLNIFSCTAKEFSALMFYVVMSSDKHFCRFIKSFWNNYRFVIQNEQRVYFGWYFYFKH